VGVGIEAVDPPDVVLVLRLQVGLRRRRVPRVEHEDGVARVLARPLAAGGEVEAEQRRRVGGDPVLDLLAVDEPDGRVRRHLVQRATVDAARCVVALQVLPIAGLRELARRRVRHHRGEEAVRERVRGVDHLPLPTVLVGDEERRRVVVVVPPVVDERLGAEEREGVSARIGAARDQHARTLRVGHLADERGLVQLTRPEADHDHAERHLDARLRTGRVVGPLDRVRVGRAAAAAVTGVSVAVPLYVPPGTTAHASTRTAYVPAAGFVRMTDSLPPELAELAMRVPAAFSTKRS
jgi:hypothetical protein